MPRRSASLKRNLLQRKGLRRSRPQSGHAVRSHAERGNEIVVAGSGECFHWPDLNDPGDPWPDNLTPRITSDGAKVGPEGFEPPTKGL